MEGSFRIQLQDSQRNTAHKIKDGYLQPEVHRLGGPQTGGPKTGGPKTGGPKTGGPKTGGRGPQTRGSPDRGGGQLQDSQRNTAHKIKDGYLQPEVHRLGVPIQGVPRQGVPRPGVGVPRQGGLRTGGAQTEVPWLPEVPRGCADSGFLDYKKTVFKTYHK